MIKVTVLEYDIGRGYEIKVFNDFKHALDYAKIMMQWSDTGDDTDVPHTTNEGMTVIHIDTEVGESVVYETFLVEQQSVKLHKGTTKRIRSLKRKVCIS